MKNYLKLIRAEQYVKNLFVLAPLFFSGEMINSQLFINAILAFVTFCFASSSIYIVNDYFDIKEDQAHPKKSKRPLASGLISTKNAFILCFILLSSSLLLSYYVNQNLTIVIGIYVIMNILYSLWLKHITILDVNIIAIGFVLRIIAGSVATVVIPSKWILLVTYLLAFFLALAKRRTDVILQENGKEVRKNIKGYNLIFIDITLGLLASIIIVCYIFYCISPEVQEHYHSDLLYISILFVINGIIRYLKLAMVDQTTYSPTLIVLKDRFIQITIFCWVFLLAYLLYF